LEKQEAMEEEEGSGIGGKFGEDRRGEIQKFDDFLGKLILICLLGEMEWKEEECVIN
jgi:hypothetical protein